MPPGTLLQSLLQDTKIGKIGLDKHVIEQILVTLFECLMSAAYLLSIRRINKDLNRNMSRCVRIRSDVFHVEAVGRRFCFIYRRTGFSTTPGCGLPFDGPCSELGPQRTPHLEAGDAPERLGTVRGVSAPVTQPTGPRSAKIRKPPKPRCAERKKKGEEAQEKGSLIHGYI